MAMKKAWSWKNVEISAETAGRLQQEFEVGFFRRALEHNPENVDILVFLGDAFSKRGMVTDGLEIDKRLVRICHEEPTFYYNLACSYSLLGDLEPAFDALQKAVQLGYQNFEHLQKDSDLDNLRQDRRFSALLKGFASQS
jgi:tetratricopeptide (TPR) repeat protein